MTTAERLSVSAETREQCVLCGRETDVEISRPVSQRNYYVEGGGQLCEECYYEVYRCLQ